MDTLPRIGNRTRVKPSLFRGGLIVTFASIAAACGSGNGDGGNALPTGGGSGAGVAEVPGASAGADSWAGGSTAGNAAMATGDGGGAAGGAGNGGNDSGSGGASTGGMSSETGGDGNVGGKAGAGARGGAGGSGGNPGAVCGDGKCNGGETQASCCSDCGCAAGATCKGGKCLVNDHAIACAATNGKDWEADCTCTAQDSNKGVPKYSGATCAGKTLDPDFCCQDSGYPGGGSCSCFPGTSAASSTLWSCLSGGAESCFCGYGVQGGSSFQCDATPEPNGTQWVCCADPKDASCYCQQAKYGGCVGGSSSVSACTTAPTGWKPRPKTCAAGQQTVSACNPDGGSCKNDSECGSNCSGTDLVCCPTCTSGKCQTCCTNGGSVQCF